MNRCLTSALGVILLVIIVMPPQAIAEDSLSAARDLYSAAEYESALKLLDRLRMGERPADQAPAIEQYRAFCLLALGRSADAEQAIAAVVSAEPSFRPSYADVSPRVRSAFREVRRKMWPSLVEQRYAAAKADYDRKDYSGAAGLFGQVLEMLADPDSGDMASSRQFADIRTLAGEFKELSLARAAPPPAPSAAPVPGSSGQSVVALAAAPPLQPQAPPVQPQAPPVHPQAPPVQPQAPPAQPQAPPSGQVTASKPPPVASNPRRIFSTADTDVVPPAAINQVLPPFPGQIGAAVPGLLEVVIDESGSVVSATMKVSVNPYYDGRAVEAARLWKYRPATWKGQPVKYRKSVQVTVKR